MPTNHIQPMEFGEIYGTTFSLIRRTLGVAIISIVLIAASTMLVMTAGMNMQAASAQMAASGVIDENGQPVDKNDTEALERAAAPVMAALVPLGGAMVLMLVVSVFAQVATAMAGWHALTDEPLTVGEIVSRSLGRSFWISLVQTIILLFVMMIVGVNYVVLTVVLAGGPGHGPPLFLTVVMMLVIAYAFVVTSMRIHRVVVEGRGPWRGIISSIALVNPMLMRTLGIVVVGMIGWGAIMYLQSVLTGTSDTMTNGGGGASAIIQQYELMKKVVTPATMALGGLLTALASVFFFYLFTPIYADLRARRGDFLEGEDEDESAVDS